VKSLGLETCATLGLLGDGHAERCATAGLDYYTTTSTAHRDKYGRHHHDRQFDDRLDTLRRCGGGVKVCCGGIVGMGETRSQPPRLIAELANMDPPPESVPSTTWCRWRARRCTGSTPLDPSSSCAPSPRRASDAGLDGAAVAGRQQMGEAVQRCVSWPAPTRSSTATSCHHRQQDVQADSRCSQAGHEAG